MTVTKKTQLLRLGQIYVRQLKTLIEADDFADRAARAFADIDRVYGSILTLEQGTWTPAIGGTGGSTGMVYSSAVGLYLRVEDFLFAMYDVALSTLGTITTDATIDGLPYVSTEDAAEQVAYWDQLGAAVLTMPSRVVATESRIRLYKLNAAATASYGTPLVQADFTNTTRLIGSITYAI